jgi:Lar family restriction alleviation protein
MELLPCPFCGDDETPQIETGLTRGSRIVVCGGCGASSDYEESAAIAAAAWNRRAANAPADPALLALAKLGAALVRGWFMGRSGFKSVGADSVSLVADESGVVALSLLTGYTLAPGIADAIAALLAPDGAASEGVADG